MHILSQTDIVPRLLVAPKALTETLWASSADTYWKAVLLQMPFWVVGKITPAYSLAWSSFLQNAEGSARFHVDSASVALSQAQTQTGRRLDLFGLKNTGA